MSNGMTRRDKKWMLSEYFFPNYNYNKMFKLNGNDIIDFKVLTFYRLLSDMNMVQF